MPWHFKFCQMLVGIVLQLSLRQACAINQHDRRANVLTKQLVCHSKGNNLLNGRMIHQHIINFKRRNFFPAPVNNLFQPAGDFQIAIFIKIALITCPEPPVGKAGRICLRVIFIAWRDIIALNTNLTFTTLWLRGTLCVKNAHLRRGCNADKPGLLPPITKWVGRHLMSRFSHPVSFNDRTAKHLNQLLKNSRWQRG